jgi:hypothetical protein
MTIDMGDGRRVTPLDLSAPRNENTTSIAAEGLPHSPAEAPPIKAETETLKKSEDIQPHKEQTEKP